MSKNHCGSETCPGDPYSSETCECGCSRCSEIRWASDDEIDYTNPEAVLGCVLAQLEDLAPEARVQVLEEALRSARLNLPGNETITPAHNMVATPIFAVEMRAPHAANIVADLLRSYGCTAIVSHRVINTNATRARIAMAVDAAKRVWIGVALDSITEVSS